MRPLAIPEVYRDEKASDSNSWRSARAVSSGPRVPACPDRGSPQRPHTRNLSLQRKLCETQLAHLPI